MFFLFTTGYETKRFNNLINNKLQNLDKKVTLDLKKIKLKLDLRKMNFFLSTKDLEASYDKTPISFQQVKIYFDLNSCFVFHGKIFLGKSKGIPHFKSL